MPNASQQFPHIFLKFVKSGTAASGGFPRPTQQSLANKGDAGGHGGRLKTSVSSIVSDWQTVREQRSQEGKPDLPDAAPLILKVDPQAFDADKLKSFGIEVILELEDGYIIGASADAGLTQLQEKIEKFMREEYGSGRVAQIYEVLEGRLGRLEYILSEELMARWDQIKDDESYVVEIGVACVGLTSQFSDYPRRTEEETDEHYAQKIARWSDRRQQTEQEWNELLWKRQDDFLDFIQNYQHEIIQDASWDDRSHVALLPDSFSCVIEITGKGLKDVVINFPFVFDVSEPDQFAEPTIGVPFLPSPEPTFMLEPPSLLAPRVCVIDSGMQEQHQYLASAIDTVHSQCWIPGESHRTSDDVTGGGHGTRVAGAVLYPRGLPKSGSHSAVCWLQNARVLNRDGIVPKKLNLSEVLNEIVEFYYNRTGTRIFNHSITGSVPCRLQYMSAWAAEIDYLTWRSDILFILAAGNIPIYRGIGLGLSRRTIYEHFEAGLSYPEYLLKSSSRIANPAQSFQALTVGSISHTTYEVPPIQSIAKEDYPSAFSCSGYGIWDSIKPDVVEYGGDLAMDSGQPPSFPNIPELCPELVRSTTGGTPLSDQGAVRTSYAAPKVAHIAAVLAATFPQASCLLYRALIVHSARLPEWTNSSNEKLAQAI
ncbi:S8 family peptidase [Leptolyngbya sp. AN03gr2]|uniref:S8 family peptidase n=1 Tax=unclassified Leptolyngbya TaxID=2650499 RepID=UPI003D31580F